MYKLFRQPEDDEVCIIGADPADGGSDYCAAIAKSKKHSDSFLVFHHHMESSQFGYELHKMAKFIQKATGHYPLIGVERNTGAATISTLQLLNYSALFRMPKLGVAYMDEEENGRIGWITNGYTRPKMLDDLSLSLRQKTNVIYDEATVRELMSFIRNSRTGRPEGASGANDDLVMAEAIAWQICMLAPATAKESLQSQIHKFPKQVLFDKHGNPTV